MIGSAPEFSVSSFVAALNQSMDMLYPEVLITGELANFRISKNMWVYFDLKDEGASVKFFGSVRSIPGPLEDGMLLEVVARPYLHPQFSFSMQVNSVRPVGVGSINKALLLLQKKLEAEGLFSLDRKRELPYAPEKIGLIASKESAGYGDFIKILRSRWPKTRVELFNVTVQGKDAPGEIIEAIATGNQRTDLECLVIVRGGGSKDDLAGFDHEQVVRAIGGSRLPTIVAIGHERDTALAELAADVRASTPSNAAELLVPDRNAEAVWLKSRAEYMESVVASFSDALKREIAEYQQLLDSSLTDIFTSAKEYAGYAGKLLQAYDPKMPLQRGYSLARSKNGSLIASKNEASQAGTFSLEFKDGTINVEKRED